MKRRHVLAVIVGVLLFEVGVGVGVLVNGSDEAGDQVAVAPPVLLPLEGVTHEVRRLAEPGYTGRWDGTPYDFLNLNEYVYSWHRRAPAKTFRFGEWTFGVSKETLPDGAFKVASTVISSQVMVPDYPVWNTRYVMWARHEPVSAAGHPARGQE